MTKAKAIEILNQEYDALSCRRMLCNKPDDVGFLDDLMIALLTAIDALEQDNGWISVKDRMPEEGVDVLVYLNRKSADVHWRPLPEPPKESDEE